MASNCAFKPQDASWACSPVGAKRPDPHLMKGWLRPGGSKWMVSSTPYVTPSFGALQLNGSRSERHLGGEHRQLKACRGRPAPQATQALQADRLRRDKSMRQRIICLRRSAKTLGTRRSRQESCGRRASQGVWALVPPSEPSELLICGAEEGTIREPTKMRRKRA